MTEEVVVNYLELARQETSNVQARELCFKGLTRNSSDTALRLYLAKLFYQDGYVEFAVRELISLKRYFSSPSLERLLKSLGYEETEASDFSTAKVEHNLEKLSKNEEGNEVVAEIEIDDAFLEVLDDVIEKPTN